MSQAAQTGHGDPAARLPGSIPAARLRRARRGAMIQRPGTQTSKLVPVARAVKLRRRQLVRETAAPVASTGERHDEANMASIDR